MSDARHVPVTRREFDALTARVDDHEARIAALETNTEPVPPDPEPIPPDPEPQPPGQGVQAKRMANMIEMFGVNTFSSLDSGNVWGSWPADYRPQTVIASLKWIVQDNGYQLGVREYHYSGRYDMQRQWFPQLVAAFPQMQNIICPGANMSPNDVNTMMQLAKNTTNNIKWVEGLNEPNTDFGSGQVPVNTTMDIQQRVWNARGDLPVFGPSVVAGMPHPEGWITGYFGNQMDAVNKLMVLGNGHYYPPGSPDVPNTGWSVNEYVGGLWTAYARHDIGLTEFHPTLYNSQGHKPDQPGWSGARDAYYTITTLYRVAGNGTHSLWWYALFDYGTVYKCGLYPTNANNPRESAFALRALCSICPDRGNNRRTFQPGQFEYSVSGNDDTCSHDLYQSSDGTFYIALWRSVAEPGGNTTQVSFTFPSKPEKVEEFNITKIAADKQTNNYTPVQVDTSRSGRMTSQLDGSARIIRITQG